MEHGHDHGSTLTGKRLALSIFMTCAFVVGEAIAGYFAQLAGASPPGLHKDGEKYIATHLLGRCGAQGGEVIITDNDKHEMDSFTMREPGECYVFDDDRIWHMLTPVAVLDGNQYAYRDTLAFDMLPEGWEPAK